MHFSIIYSVDVLADRSIVPFRPPTKQLRRLWRLTETGFETKAGVRLKHRKWCALLPEEQFREFVDTVGVYASETETMGSLGAPGYGIGWAPAISFDSDDPECWRQNAYVTPCGTLEDLLAYFKVHHCRAPQVLQDAPGQGYLYEGVAEAEQPLVWKRLRQLVIAEYAA